MKPQRKYHFYITIVTVVIMYVVVSHILPQIQDDATREPWFDALATLAGGVGTYTMLSKTLLLAMEHVRIVKRLSLIHI